MSAYSPHPDDLEEPPLREEWRRIADAVLPGNREQLAEERAGLDIGSLALQPWQGRFLGVDLAKGRDSMAFMISTAAGASQIFDSTVRWMAQAQRGWGKTSLLLVAAAREESAVRLRGAGGDPAGLTREEIDAEYERIARGDPPQR